MSQNTNPLLTKLRIPGETFRLPSMGILYTNGELSDDVKDGEVTVNPMTAFNEIIMKSPDKLFSGKAIVEVLKDCVPQINKPEELFAKDIDFLMLCLKKVSYGNFISMNYTHSCEYAKSHEYSIPLSTFLKNTKSIDPTTITELSEITLENGQVITLHSPKYKNIIELLQSKDEENQTTEQIQQKFVKNILSLITSIDGITDENLISEWVKEAPVKYINVIAENIEKVSDWGPNYMTTIECQDCKKMEEVVVPINPVSFFT